ncbi:MULTISPECIES: branched-chain amino acid ABC transporter permease [Halobacterium]|uniref:branched-chain amino acid ABC transporter permease n=1 Tax=Halobacterium TaxID=2239 RepID=UPI00073E4363|nr:MULTISPECIES: branched-chain amino acid ABC transporter permease [Halobacterium]MCG1003258.1 branched-chain amino acid ABC transporter permease [Halobacterium noricense]
MASLTDPFEGLFESRRRVAIAVVGVLALAAVPYSTTAYITELVFTGLVFVMLGVSWNLVAGYAGQISLGHHAFFGLGAFVSAWLTTPGRAGLPEVIQSPAWLAIAVGALAAGLLALVLGPLLFRLTGHYFAIGTLAVAAIVQLVLLDQRRFSGGSTGYYVRNNVQPETVFVLMLLATVAVILVTYGIVNSRSGLGMRAIHDDEDAASSLGVNPLRYKLMSFAVASGMAGLAGGLFAQFSGYINADSTLGVTYMVDTLVVVVLGGMGTMAGPLVGAGLFLSLDTVLRRTAGEFATTIEGALIIIFVIFVPGGLYKLLSDVTVADVRDAVEDIRREVEEDGILTVISRRFGRGDDHSSNHSK